MVFNYIKHLIDKFKLNFCNEQLLQRVTSEFCKRVTSDFTTSDEQRVKVTPPKLAVITEEIRMSAVITSEIRKLAVITGEFRMLAIITDEIRMLAVITGEFRMLVLLSLRMHGDSYYTCALEDLLLPTLEFKVFP